MNSVFMFRFREESTADQRESVLATLRLFPHVHKAAMIDPRSESALVRREAFARCDDAALERVKDRVGLEFPEVEKVV